MISHFQSFIFTKIEKKKYIFQMSESEDDENCFTTVYNSQTQKEIALLFLIRLCDLCPKTMLQWAWNRIWRLCHLQNMPKIILVTFSFSNLWNLIDTKNIKKHNLNNSINSLKSPPELIVKNCYKILIFDLLSECKMRRGF